MAHATRYGRAGLVEVLGLTADHLRGYMAGVDHWLALEAEAVKGSG